MKKNRTLLGIISIAIAAAICFVITPIFNNIFDAKQEVVRAKSTIIQGKQITEDDIEVLEVGSYNLPEKLATNKDQIVGLYATSNIYSGDYIFPEKVSETIDNADSLLMNLKEGEMAMSISIQSLSSGVSGKLKQGDLIKIFTKADDEMISPKELQFVEILVPTDSAGKDFKNTVNKSEANNSNQEESEDSTPKTIIIKVQNAFQAKALALSEQETMHIAFVTRDEAEKNKLLEQQKAILAEAEQLEIMKNISGENEEVINVQP